MAAGYASRPWASCLVLWLCWWGMTVSCLCKAGLKRMSRLTLSQTSLEPKTYTTYIHEWSMNGQRQAHTAGRQARTHMTKQGPIVHTTPRCQGSGKQRYNFLISQAVSIENLQTHISFWGKSEAAQIGQNQGGNFILFCFFVHTRTVTEGPCAREACLPSLLPFYLIPAK